MDEVYQQLPQELQEALRAFENGALDRIIARKRPEDFAALRRLLQEPADPTHRQRAIYAVGRWGDPAVVPDIIRLLPTLPESHVYTAIEALGRFGTAAARDAVAGRADDPSPQVRKFVVEALARMADAPALAVLEKMARGDSEGWIRDLADRRMKKGRRRPP